jgi:hypothetical protein
MLEQMEKAESRKAANLMASTWTKAALVRRAFNAGPRRKFDRQFEDLEDAVLAAYISYRDVRREMRKWGLPEADTRAAFVMMPPFFGPPFNSGAAVMLRIPDSIHGLPTLLKDAQHYAKEGEGDLQMSPLGVVFWQRDQDERAKEKESVWVQMWRVDPRLQRAANAVRDEFRELDGYVADGGFGVTFDE